MSSLAATNILYKPRMRLKCGIKIDKEMTFKIYLINDILPKGLCKITLEFYYVLCNIVICI